MIVAGWCFTSQENKISGPNLQHTNKVHLNPNSSPGLFHTHARTLIKLYDHPTYRKCLAALYRAQSDIREHNFMRGPPVTVKELKEQSR